MITQEDKDALRVSLDKSEARAFEALGSSDRRTVFLASDSIWLSHFIRVHILEEDE